ncbi:Protein kinase domain-containing protein [Hirschfeldia incana]|nr:Protein kinase domain-containing protein [Hirschfeldia incana]
MRQGSSLGGTCQRRTEERYLRSCRFSFLNLSLPFIIVFLTKPLHRTKPSPPLPPRRVREHRPQPPLPNRRDPDPSLMRCGVAIDKKSPSKRLIRNCLTLKSEYSLLKEISILRTIDHPNIIRLHESIETGDRIFLVLEYCSGGDLAEYINLHGKVSKRVAKHFMRQLAGVRQYDGSKKQVLVLSF